jgi:hypothetical protein
MPAFTSCKSSGKMPDAAVQQKITQSIENRDFKIIVNQMIPMSGSARHLTSLYSLKLKQDSVFSYLPYFGRAYSVPYGGGQGLTFDGVVEEYQQKRNAKGVYQISFKSKTPEDTYSFSVEIYDNGSSQIRVNSHNRQSISFLGEVEQQ